MGESQKFRTRIRMEILMRYKYLSLVLILFLGCSKDNGSNCFTRQGNIVSIERILVGNVTTLDIRDDAVVTIKQGSELKAIVRGGENLLDSYKTTVEGDRLIIENLTTCGWTRDLSTPFEVTLTIPSIKSIYYTGYGGFYTDGPFNVDTLLIDIQQGVGEYDLELYGNKLELIHHTGAANVYLKGSFDFVYIYSTSQSIFDMSDLIVTNGFYVNGGTGNMTINTSDYIKVKLDLTGNIFYSNDPEIYIESHTGSGELIHY